LKELEDFKYQIKEQAAEERKQEERKELLNKSLNLSELGSDHLELVQAAT